MGKDDLLVDLSAKLSADFLSIGFTLLVCVFFLFVIILEAQEGSVERPLFIWSVWPAIGIRQ